jgi:hypothetical protein
LDFGGIVYEASFEVMYSLISFVPYALSAKILLPFISILERTSTACVLSCKLPDDSLKYTGLPRPSTIV